MFSYAAFISYSHGEDGHRAPALQKALQNIAKPWYRRRAIRVFRDETNLSASPELWPQIESALSQAEWLILLSSPRSALSKWVGREIEWWLTHRSASKILLVKTAGEIVWDDARNDFDLSRSSAIHPALSGRFGTEPLHIDLSQITSDDDLLLRNAIFRTKALQIAAQLHGKSPDEIGGEDVRVYRRNLTAAWAAVALVTIGAVAAGWQAVLATQARDVAREQEIAAKAARDSATKATLAEQLARRGEAEQRIFAEGKRREADENAIAERVARMEAVRQQDQARARELSARSDLIRRDEPQELTLSVLLAVESAKRARSFESDLSLRRSLSLVRRLRAQIPAKRGGSSVIAATPTSFVAVSEQNGVSVWNSTSIDQVTQIATPSRMTKAVISSTGRLMTHSPGEHQAMLFSGDRLEHTKSLDFDRSIIDIAISEDGEFGAASGAGQVRVWSLQTREAVATLPSDGPNSLIAFSADGDCIVAVKPGALGWTATVWRWKIGSKVELRGHQSRITSAALSRDGRWLVTGSWDKTARVWDTNSGDQTAWLPHWHMVNAVALSPDGVSVATASGDSFARVWLRATGEKLAEMQHRGPVTSIAFHPLSKLVVTGSADRTARVWDSTNGQEVARLVHTALVRAVTFALDGSGVATIDDSGNGRLWETQERIAEKTFPHDIKFDRIEVSADGRRVATAAGPTAYLWDVAAHSPGIRLSQPSAVTALAISPNGKLLAIGNKDGATIVLDAESGRELGRSSQSERVSALAFSPNSRLLVIGSWDKTATILDLTESRIISRCVHDSQVYAISFAPDGTWFATAGDGKEVRIWSPLTGERLASLDDDLPHVGRIVVSPDSKWLATIATPWESSSVHLWERPGWKRRNLTYKSAVGPMTFSADSRQLATGQANGQIVVSELTTGKSTRTLQVQAPVGDLRFDATGGLLASTSADGTARVWNWSDGAELTRLEHRFWVSTAIWSPDGKNLTTYGRGSTKDPESAELVVTGHRLSSGQLIDEACARLSRNLTPIEWAQYMFKQPYRKTCPALPDGGSDVVRSSRIPQ